MSSLDVAAPVVAGATARTLSMFCVTPIEVLRVRIQAMRESSVGMSNLGAFDWGQGRSPLQKARALWSGFGATVHPTPTTNRSAIPCLGCQRCAIHGRLLGVDGTDQVTHNFIKISDAAVLCRKGLSRGSDEGVSDLLFANSAAGFSAGIVASVLTHPMDVVKTRIQIAQRSGSVPKFANVSRQIYSTEGIRGLFAGVTPRTLRIGPSCAIVISTYELLKRIL